MTQAPATPELVESDDWALEIAACGFANDSTLPESVRSFIKDLWRAYCAMEERADALEAQHARIAGLEGLIADVNALCTEINKRWEASQALADRYEKALRNLFTTAERVVLSIEQDESGRWLLDGDGERLAGDLLESVDATRQALSSQGRREGGESREWR